MALRPSDDTEFNDALRARGILPKLPEREKTPSPELVPTARDRLESGDNDLLEDDLLGLEDDLPASVLDAYRESRLAELKALHSKHRFNGMREISRDDYTREVTEGSKAEIDSERDGTGVVCFLYKDSVPESQLLRKHLENLSKVYPATKFVCIVGDRCIPNYPDKNIPTLLLYRNGEMKRQLIGLGGKGMKTTQQDIEAILFTSGILDRDLRVPSADEDDQNGDESD